MIAKEEIITTDKYLEAFPEYYQKTDFLYSDTRTVWRGTSHPPFASGQEVLITGHSDLPVTDSLVSRFRVKHWFTVNKQTKLVHGLPLGITNDCDDSPIHRVYGNIPMMLEVREQPRTMKNLVYMNFSQRTFPQERQPIWNFYLGNEWVTDGEHRPTMEGRREYLRMLRSHWFVLCPRGNGIDTHRLWETLYLGGIPVVKRDIAHADWDDLPILFVDDWHGLTEAFFERARDSMAVRTWNMDKLRVQYWIERIGVAIQGNQNDRG